MAKNNRRHGVFAVDQRFADVALNSNEDRRDSLTIEKALNIIFRQMEITGSRPRTIESYSYVFNDFVEHTGLIYVEEINADSIYDYLNDINVAKTTKLLRLKTIKAVLSRFFDNRWVEYKFWKNIQIKIDKQVKPAAKESDIEVLLKLIDRSTFIGFRDTVAILLMYKTGIRIRTLGELRERHIDFDNKMLNLEGAVLKNHDYLKLPIDEQLAEMLQTLILQNAKIRRKYKKRHDYVFITQNGLGINRSDSSSNAISKQLSKYAKLYGLKNINAHAIRRAFAKNLLNKGASVALISKALGHQDLSTTTQYLDLNKEEVANSLRDYL
ncbi:site-specific integrase [Rummeliibacillus sp. SL167]|uniref:tyrosine-type recombinase/integrase n=1 Tax=Rummeliibacillus sp. SL167 TaxID=2579792 RepID=UPI0011B39883|nr:site-specific integrase [Rummeliibacillus sp. SL167]